MSIIPGSEPRPEGSEPMLADEPLPPGEHDIEETVDALDQKVRQSGSEEVAEAQESKEEPDEPTQDESDPQTPPQEEPDVS
ncbi:MAG: hypothetical protein DI571_03045 [Arsenicicoccus sp.]|uniref:hypothetical protein n=1 Tax=Serinicoccus profundi TaxID=1078471 RepID=UPI000255E997|nr:hypothetical protein [Serinicoccus profundi]PZU48844.1 MAG: hypothetical protein DI571_03045 [Arsenicicoccus sp.]